MAASIVSRLRSTGAVMMSVLALSACEAALTGAGTGEAAKPAEPAAPAAQYITATDHFSGMQRAGLSGNYAAFAEHLKPVDPAQVMAELSRSFRGQPFDVYTQKYNDSGAEHRRLVELRSTAGRLYLYVELDRVPGGWIVGSYELTRKRQDVERRI